MRGGARSPLTTRLSVAVGVGLLLIGGGPVTVSDGTTVLAVAQSLVHHASVEVPQANGVPGLHGQFVGKYGLGLSLLALLPVALGDLASLVLGHRQILESLATSTLMALVGALLVRWLIALGEALGGSRRTSAVVALATVFGTFVLPYTKDFFSEPVVALMVVIGAESLLKRRYLLAGAALGFAVLVRPDAALALVLVPLAFDRWRGLDRARFAALTRVGVAAAPFVALALLYNVVRFGSPTSSGYEYEPGFTTPLWEGARGLLLSYEKSLLLFAPLVLLVVPALVARYRVTPAPLRFLALHFLAVFGLAATWHSWQGGWSWGPRLLLVGLVPLMPVLAPWLDRRVVMRPAALALAALGLVVSASTVLVPTQAQQLDQPRRSDPTIVRQWELLPKVATTTSTAFAHPVPEADVPGSGAHRRFLWLWQVGVLRALGRGAFLGTLVLSIFVAGALCWWARTERAGSRLVAWVRGQGAVTAT